MKKIKIIPAKQGVKQYLRPLLERLRLLRNSIFDFHAYNQFATIGGKLNNPSNVRYSLLFHAHSLEKGLSHQNFRPNFGNNALSALVNDISAAQRMGISSKSMEFQNAVAVLRDYKRVHHQRKLETPYFDKIVSQNLLSTEEAPQWDYTVSDESIDTDDTSYKGLVKRRHSTRDFADEQLDMTRVKEAVELAINTPSVCNRQPWQVTTTQNKELIAQLLKIQGGFTGYKLPPALALVTTDLRAFRDSGERNEAYVDGGLFLMNFLLALTDQEIATCTLNTMAGSEKIKKIRKILDLPESHILIAFVALGNFPERYGRTRSEHKALKDVYTEV